MKKNIIVYFIVSFIIIISIAGAVLVSTGKSEYSQGNTFIVYNDTEISEIDSKIAKNLESKNKKPTEKSSESAYIENKTEEIIQNLMIDLNTGQIQDFIKLNGIGEVIAERIIKYRDTHGLYRCIEDIMNVEGIGDKTFFSIKDHIYVNASYFDNTDEYTYEQYSEVNNTVAANETFNVTEPSKAMTEATEIMHIDINKAGIEEFAGLPGIDINLAENIIELRNNIKRFSHPYELLYAEGMTEQKVSNILDYVYVENK